MKPKPGILIIFLLCLIGHSHLTNAAVPNEPTWISEPGNLYQLSIHLRDLYLSLKADGALPVRRYIDNDGFTIETILRNERQFFGAIFPREVDGILCELNRHVCSADRRSSGEGIYRWKNKPGDQLTIPDFHFTIYSSPQKFYKKKDETLQEIIVNRAFACTELSDTCYRILKNTNQRTPVLDPDYEGPITVDVTALSLPLPKKPSPRAASWEKLRENIAPKFDFKIQAENANNLPDDVINFGKAITTHIGNAGLWPRLNDLITYKVVIAVFDTPVDTEHCYLKAAKLRSFAKQVKPAEVKCGAVVREARISDHGTHIVGLILAPSHNTVTVGINPVSEVHAYEAYSAEINNNALEFAKSIYHAVRNEGASIINLSLFYKPQQGSADPIHKRIVNLADTLFVAAAGNTRVNAASSSCAWYPACSGLSNVISVIALDMNDPPSIWVEAADGSNYGPQFDIAVLGEKVWSTISGGRWGYMSGTSQSTAIVTAAASILLGMKQKLKPSEVKERLIYTSDLFSALEGKSKGGRLNIQRAIDDHDGDVIELKDNTTVRGTLRRDQTLRFSRRPGGGTESATLSSLRRIGSDERGGVSIFRRINNKLERINVATFQPTTLVVDNDQGEQSIKITDVKNFYSRLYVEE